MKKKLLEIYQKRYPFHMPGHKLGRLAPIPPEELYAIDFTEVEGSDNLHYPSGIIQEAQEYAASVFGTSESHFLVNGSTSGILAALSACCRKNDKVLIGRNCHRSAYNALLLNELTPIYVYPEGISELGIFGGILPEKIEEALITHPDITCVFITSPTYEGIVSDIGRISEIVHRHNKILIVDEAHGAHFVFHPIFPSSAASKGADLVIHSLHKTLPAFTQSAMLHVIGERVDRLLLKEYLRIFQTTSPSYILMAGMDCGLHLIAQNEGEIVEEFVDKLTSFRQAVDKLTNIKLLNSELVGHYGIYGIDPSRIVILGRNRTLDAEKAAMLIRDIGIEPEMLLPHYMTFITAFADQEKGFKRLLFALQQLNKEAVFRERVLFALQTKIDTAYPLHEAFRIKGREVTLDNAIGRVSKGYITLYPPGIPVLVPGERITAEIIEKVKEYMDKQLTVNGIKQNRLIIID